MAILCNVMLHNLVQVRLFWKNLLLQCSVQNVTLKIRSETSSETSVPVY